MHNKTIEYSEGLNPYFYTKYLYEFIDRKQAIVFFNNYLKKVFYNPDRLAEIERANAEYNLDITDDIFEDYEIVIRPQTGKFSLPYERSFHEALSMLIRCGDFIGCDYHKIYRSLWEVAPIRDVWREMVTYKFDKDEPFHRNQKDEILNTLQEQLEMGWITFEYDKLREMGFQNGGRVIIDIDSIREEDLGTSYLEASEFLYSHFQKLKKEGLILNNENFWEKQQNENPIRVSEIFINLIFGSYRASMNKIYNNLKWNTENTFFRQAAINSLQYVIDNELQPHLDFLPKLAGYNDVSNSKEWLLKLIDLLNKYEHNAEILGERSATISSEIERQKDNSSY